MDKEEGNPEKARLSVTVRLGAFLLTTNKDEECS